MTTNDFDSLFSASPSYLTHPNFNSLIGLFNVGGEVRQLTLMKLNERLYVDSDSTMYVRAIEMSNYEKQHGEVTVAVSKYLSRTEFDAVCSAVGVPPSMLLSCSSSSIESTFRVFLRSCLSSRHHLMYDSSADRALNRLLFVESAYGLPFIMRGDKL